MGGLAYDTGSWPDKLWSGHIQRSTSAQELMREGHSKQSAYLPFSQDVHARLYLANEPARATDSDVPNWAETLHNELASLAEWQTLKKRCGHNGFGSGVATERLLRAILPRIPEQQEQNTEDGQGDSEDGSGGHSGVSGGDDAALRRALRQACRDAAQEVDDAEQTMQDVMTACGTSWGNGSGADETLKDLDEVRQAYNIMRHVASLRHVANIAGRLKRLARSTKRTTVQGKRGRINGITTGGNFEQILPSQLAGMRSSNRLVRLGTLDRILSRRALCYQKQQQETVGQGPIVVCLDESVSMRFGGQQAPDSWAKAAGLALLMSAGETKRDYCLIGFSDSIRHINIMPYGKVTPEDIVSAFCHRPSGGTDFDLPLGRAMDIIEHDRTMQKADIVFITDGDCSLWQETIDRMNTQRQAREIHLYVLAIGADEAWTQATFGPVADEIHMIDHVQDGNGDNVAAHILNKTLPL